MPGSYNFGALFGQAKVCISCGEKALYRIDKIYVFLVKVLAVTSFILSLFLVGKDDFRTYTVRFAGIEEKIAGFSLLASLAFVCFIGIYESFIKKYRYRCKACGVTRIEKSDMPMYLRIFIFFMLAILFATPFLIIAANRYIEANRNPYSLRQ